MSRRLRLAGIIAAGVVGLVLAVLFTISQVRAGEALAGVTVEGVDVGGLGREDTIEVIETYADRRSSETIVLTHQDLSFEIDPVAVGAAVDVETAADRALRAGREGTFVARRWAAITGATVDVSAPAELDGDAVTARLEEIAAEVDTDLVEGEVSVDPSSLAVQTVQPVDGVTVLVDQAREDVLEAFAEEGEDTLELATDVTPSITDASGVERAAAAAEDAVAADLVLASDDGEVTLTPRELAPMISSTVVEDGDGGRIELVVTTAAVEEHVVPIVDPLLRAPLDASFDAPRQPPTTFDDQDDAVWRPVSASVEVVPGRTGTELDVEVAADQLTQTVRAAERRVVLRLVEVQPDFSTQDAQDADVDTLLSTFTTYHSCCQTRVTNIQKLADMVNDTVVLPGEQFSINQISGNRTCDKGFAQAGMILDGEIVDVCGGGVSQFGTTTVNALFFAGLDPDAYKPHSFYISRYPMAREATLNYPSPDIDVRFTNDTGAPIIVTTTYTGTSITVSFYGNSDVTEVRADLGGTYNVRDFQTERRRNSDLAPGASRVVQSGAEGFSVGLDRTVVRADGSSSTDDWTNTYVSKKQIIEYNPSES